MDPIVIVGSGLAGYTLARELRKLDSGVPLTILSRDDGSFYSKPMLSNALAAGKSPRQIASASGQDMAAQLQARILSGIEVTAVDTGKKFVYAGGLKLPYSKLVLALGADAIRPELAGDASDALLSVNDLADYARFRGAIERKSKVALLGAGLIGCEFANDLLDAGYAVHIIDPSLRPLGSLLPEAAATRLKHALAEIGAVWHLGRTARALFHEAAGLRLELDDGSLLKADAVLSAIGLRPRIRVAQDSGLKVGRGIVTDAYLRTSAADVYALGDCAEVDGKVLPYVLPLMQSARALAKTLAGAATAVVFPAMPIVVKTPAVPVVACPPPTANGSWKLTEDVEGLEAKFESASGDTLGYVLLGRATSRKQALTRMVQSAPSLGHLSSRQAAAMSRLA